MKGLWIAVIVACCSFIGLAQNNEKKVTDVLNKSKLQSFKNTNPIERIFIEASSRYSVRKEKLKPGIIPSYEYGTKLWLQTPNAIKLKNLTEYPEGSFQLTEKLAFDDQIKNSIKIKGINETGFVPIMLAERGDPKKNEQILLEKTKYEAFCLSFPVLLSSNENLSFEYVGVVTSGDRKADVLATSFIDNYKIRLYFDQITHQLLLMSVKFIEPKTSEEITQKHFFSDYKEVNGINFAHKIIIHENGEIIEERDIKVIEINPKLEPNFFEVKK